MRTLTTWLALALLSAPLFAVPTSDRCPGEGPKPLAEVPWEDNTAVALKTPTPVRDFVLFERRGMVVYRDSNQQVFRRSVDPAGTAVPAAPSISAPLSTAHDPDERYLVAENFPFYFDALYGRGWFDFNPPVNQPKNLFWGNGELYGMERPPEDNSPGPIHLFRYRPGSWLSWKVCRNLWVSNDQFSVAEGSRYPYLSLYKTFLTTKGHGIMLYRVNVESCGLDQPALFFDKLPGPATRVQVVSQPYGAAIHVEQPTKKVLWYRDGACRYFDVEGGDVTIPNPDIPMFAVRNTLKLWLLDPEAERYTALRPSLPATALRDRDLTLTSDGASVIVAPKDVDGNRRLLRIDLPKAMRRQAAAIAP